MGVRIDMYAIDVVPFTAFVSQPVGLVLSFYAEHATSTSRSLCFFDEGVRFRAKHGTGVLRGDNRKEQVVTDGSECEFLRQSMDDFLKMASSFQLCDLLNALCACPVVDFVQWVSNGQKYYWLTEVCGFVNGLIKVRSHWSRELERKYGPHAYDFSLEDCERFLRLAEVVFRGYRYTDPPAEEVVAVAGFPVIPAEDCDLRMGLWSEADAYFVAGFARQLRAFGIQIESPSDMTHEVNEMLDRLIGLEDLVRFKKLVIASFIG